MNGNKIAYLRKQRGLTQQELADLLGVSKITVSFWERGTRAPELEMLGKIADFFRVSVDYLLDRTENPNSHKDDLEALVRQIVNEVVKEAKT